VPLVVLVVVVLLEVLAATVTVVEDVTVPAEFCTARA
jgi:hypothetical protein